MAKAYLVGAGPGDPRLLTIAALEAMQDADVVLCDRLVTNEVLSLVNPAAEIIYVGKKPGEQEEAQNAIFEYFMTYAASDKTLVRLKGGDPYVFGRGGEEYLFLRKAGYEVIVIPGISAAVGLPTLAGIPLTARNTSSAFAVVTGHNSGDGQVDWSDYAKIDTLVILMAVKERAQIAAALIDAGRDATEPVAFIENGSRHTQRVVRATLAEVEAGQVDVESPCVFVVGHICAFYDAVDQVDKVNTQQLRYSFTRKVNFGRRRLRVVKPAAKAF
jgi:uroporphyrin-III C-methyltransferase